MSEVQIPDDWEKFGPKLKALPTDKMRTFCWCYVHNGGQIGRAAAQAGYGEGSDNERVASASGSRLMQNQAVLDALEELTWRRLNGMAMVAVQALEPILNNPAHKSHAKAIEMVLERTGFVAERKLTIDKPEGKSDAALLATLAELCNKLGADPEKFLGPLAKKLKVHLDVEDAEVVEIPDHKALPKPLKKAPKAAKAPEHDLGDLEDLL